MENKNYYIKNIMKDKSFLKVKPEIIKKFLPKLKIGIIIDSGQNLFLKLDKIDENLLNEIYDEIQLLKNELNKKLH